MMMRKVLTEERQGRPHLGRFRRMSRWTLHLSAFCDESKGLQTLVKLLSTAH